MDNRKFFGFVRRALAGALFGMAALATTAARAEVEVSIDGVSADGAYERTMTSGTIIFNIILSEDLVSVSGSPRLKLKGISNFSSSSPEAIYAEHAGSQPGTRELNFSYEIRPGDFATAIDVDSIDFNGATITVSDGSGTGTLPSLPLPSLTEDGDGDHTWHIAISTFYFKVKNAAGEYVVTNRVVVPDSYATVGKAYPRATIYGGGGNLSQAVDFRVSAEYADEEYFGKNVKFAIFEDTVERRLGEVGTEGGSCSLTLPATGSVTPIVTPSVATPQGVVIRINPKGAGGPSDADLFIVYPDGIEENEVTIESISVASADDTVYGYNKHIRIVVEFSDDIRSVSSSSSSQPMLMLNVNNQNNDSANTTANTFKDFAAYDSSRPYKGNKMYFLYTVKAGDYVKDLDVTDVQNFFNSIQFDSGADLADDVPTGTDSRSLASNSNVGIQTIIFSDYSTATPDITVVEDMTLNLVISRGGAATKAQNFSITSFGENGETLRSGDKISWPSTQGFSIPANSDRATLEVTAVEAGTQILRLHPQGYDGTDGDLVATFTVTPGTTLPSVQLSGPSSVEEGADPFTVNVSLSKPAKEAVTVEVKSANHNCLAIASTSSGTMRHNSTDGDYAVITFPAYSTAAVALTVNPLDGLVNGSNTVALEATHITNRTTKAVYSSYTHSVRVVNRPPEVSVSPTDEDGNWLVTGFAAMSEGVLTWTASDASGVDLRNGISASIDFGDGTSTNVTCTASGGGMVRHSYIKANGNEEKLSGGYTVQLTVVDKDGGQYTVRGRVIVNPPVIGLIQEYKRDGGNTYVSEQTQAPLKGLGEGSIIDMNNTEKNPYHPPYDWHSYYNAGQGPVLFTGEPATFQAEHPAAHTNATFDSFFHVWIGESFTTEGVLDPARHQRTATVDITDDTSEFTIGAVFSKEFYPEDNYADADNDRLPDDWENAAWPEVYAFENTGGSEDAPYGTADNPDHDYLPACAVVMADGTIGTSGYDYSPNGLAFDNRYEVRGTHWGLNARGSDPVGPQDEPHGTYNKFSGFYGTDPTSADTDGDLLTDGWEYFFWRQAAVSNKLWIYEQVIDEETGEETGEVVVKLGERYDPTQVVKGNPIEASIIAGVFNPCEKASHLTLDTDGDGLTNFEEFLLGTNPIHWDTDGDTMNDGWEVMWGLDPCNRIYDDANDADHNNPDDDFMAYYEDEDDNVLLHNEVYQKLGYNPRTAWVSGLSDRARVGAGRWFNLQVNTIRFSNKFEHSLGRWFIDQGYVDAVEPMSRAWMSQPVPYGTSHYYDTEWRTTANHLPDHRVSIDGEAFSAGGGNSYMVPYGPDLSFLVEGAPVITRKIDGVEYPCHGCDSDCDGMPDGWELYLCAQPREAAGGEEGDEGDEGDGEGGGAENGSEGEQETRPLFNGLDFAARDGNVDHDGDGLVARQECHSVELCDHYGRICTNFFYTSSGGTTYGNWYNKWWPTDPFDSDTDADGLTDGEEGELFRYQTRTFSFREQDLPYPEHPIEGQLGAIFGSSTMRRGHVPGGGLNPCCVDTDMDYIPDAWEAQFKGDNRDKDWEGGFCNRPGEESSLVVDRGMVTFKSGGGGMDGTYFDSRVAADEFLGKDVTISSQKNYIRKADGIYRDFDFDHDGLDNYQEYLINGVRHFQYDKWEAGKGYGGYDIQEIFATGVIHDWDWAKDVDNWQNDLTDPSDEHQPFFYMPPEKRMAAYSDTDPRLNIDPTSVPADIAEEKLAKSLYASTDPRLADSDGDNMDDFYELFHGLNPILSDVADYCGSVRGNPANGVYDFLKFPWMTGMPNADPDYDDKPNWEEALSPGQSANFNTDPTPLWMTDMSYSNSFVNLYYNWGAAANFWAEDGGGNYDRYPNPTMMVRQEVELLDIVVEPRPAYMFSFESNEGFDTDNDNIPDPYEVDGEAGGVTDPQNPDRPVARKALYLDGESAARTRSLCAFGPNALRSFTLEAWVRPEAPASGTTQVILERPLAWTPGSANTNAFPLGTGIRRNFRLGLTRDGKPFVEFDNGGTDLITENAVAEDGAALVAGKWYHLAAVRDGFAKTLSLYVNGARVATKATAAIPYTGFTDSAINSVGSQQYLKATWAPIVVGAADSNPEGKVDGSVFYNNGHEDEIEGGQPRLSNFFKGWVDEIRIWDGARPAGDDAGDQRVAKWGWPTIKEDCDNLKRYGLNETLAAQNDAIKYMERIFEYRKTSSSHSLDAVGKTFEEFREAFTEYVQGTGGEDSVVRIPPALLCAYSFDTLPDCDAGEYRQPAKFERLSKYRPDDYAGGTPWLAEADDRTTVYTDPTVAPWQFPQYAQNWVAWLPLAHIVSDGTDSGNAATGGSTSIPLYVLRADSVANSKYWTRDAKGGIAMGTGLFNSFPNSANPYGYRYETGISRLDEVHPSGILPTTFAPEYSALFNDLLPLRGARGDMTVQMWDDPEGDNIGVNADLDGDGLPDWWELENGLDPQNADQNGNGVRDDEDDFDGDGLSNYFEYLAGLNPGEATSDGETPDGDSDMDGDGLSNLQEQILGTNPANADTDDDGVGDGEEVAGAFDPLDSTRPFVLQALTFAGAADDSNMVVVKDMVEGRLTERFSSSEWTIEAWVNPDATALSGEYPLVMRGLASTGAANYELGIRDGKPYARYMDNLGTATNEAASASALGSGEWTHLAARLEASESAGGNSLTLLVNGVAVQSANSGVMPATGPGDLVLGSAGFKGQMFGIRVWKTAQEDSFIAGAMRSELLGGRIEGASGVLTLNGDGFLKENAQTVGANGALIDCLEGNWTIETWVKTSSTDIEDGAIIVERRNSDEGDEDLNFGVKMNKDGSVHCGFTVTYTTAQRDTNGVITATQTMYNDSVNDINGDIRINDGKWHHVAYVRDSSGCKLYIDGLLDGTQVRLFVPSGIQNIISSGVRALPGPVVIGKGFKGSIDETRIWNRALSAVELEEYSHRNLSGDEDGLISYLNYDYEKSGSKTVAEYAVVRDREKEFGAFVRQTEPEAFCDVVTAPPGACRYNPLGALKLRGLAGVFYGRDGGTTAEDLFHRMGGSPFANGKYAGTLGASVSFAAQAPESWLATLDSDKDGMPDAWEFQNAFDPYIADENGNGVNDSLEDSDGDGLSNYFEYLAGTNPHVVDTDGDGVSDYHASLVGDLSNGEIFTDNDHVLDSYEEGFEARYASPFLFDEDEDNDLDGWDNWSEALAGTRLEYNAYNETGAGASGATASGKAAGIPMPVLTVTLHHFGDRASGSGGSSGNSGRLVVHAYTSAEMNGWPDVVFAKTFSTDTFPIEVELSREDVIYGHLRQGANWFYAWVEQDGSKLDVNLGGPTQSELGSNWPTWTPGEPAAVADFQALGGIDIGWDRNTLSFHLVEDPLGYVRYSFQSSGNSAISRFASDGLDHTVSVGTQGTTFFTKKLKWPRVWLHEGDMQAGRTSGFGVASGIVSTKPNTYGVAVNSIDGGSVTNWFTKALSAPALKAPRDNGVVFSARPEFQFTLPDEATAFQFTVTRGSTQVYSARIPAPGYNPSYATPLTIWRLPSSVALVAGAEYTWTVKPYNAANASGGTASSAKFVMASLAHHEELPAYGRVCVNVKYPTGWAYRNSKTPTLRVQAFRTASFNGDAEGQIALAGAGPATFYGLELDTPHYFMAFIDQNGNGKRDSWEPWGYYRKPDEIQPFMPVAVTPSSVGNTQSYEIVLRDPDTDNDLMPDSIEYVLYGATYPNDFLAQAGANANIGSLRASSAGRSAALATFAASATGDADGDGVADLAELIDGTDAGSADSDGDGIDDGDEKALFGTAAASKEAQTLEITGINIDDNGDVSFEWGWSNAPATDAAAVRSATASAAGSAPATGGLRRASAPPPVTGLRYVIEATDSLSEPSWQEVKRVGALNGEISGGTLPESETGAMFFRIRLEK